MIKIVVVCGGGGGGGSYASFRDDVTGNYGKYIYFFSGFNLFEKKKKRKKKREVHQMPNSMSIHAFFMLKML